MFFDHLTLMPQEGLFETYLRYLRDDRDNKVNLSIGMYYDDKGNVPLFSSVKKAEIKFANEGKSKAYLPMGGLKTFQESFAKLVLGDENFEAKKDQLSLFQTIGATGALSTVGHLLVESLIDTIYLSDPTWSNHKSMFSKIGLKLQPYPYLDKETNLIKSDALLEKLSIIPKGSVLLFHTCCHNPTGVDPTKEQWDRIIPALIEREIFPIFDTAYQGLADSLEQDVYPIRILAEKGVEFACTVSASKNFGLYGERVGLLMVCSGSKAAAEKVSSRLQGIIRSNYSNPHIHGAAIVDMILRDEALKNLWVSELDDVRFRIKEKRTLLYNALKANIPDRDFSFILSHKGMFSLLGLNPEKVKTIEEKGFYLAPSGRINIAGVRESNVLPFAEAMRDALYNK